MERHKENPGCGGPRDIGQRMAVLPMEISPKEALRQLGDESSGKPLLLDVREEWEVLMVNLCGDSQWIPTNQLGRRWSEVPRDRQVFVYCHHGIRSLFAAQFLRGKGYDRVQSLQGGIDRWAAEIEPEMRRY